MYFCFFVAPQIMPDMHANANAPANPTDPSQMPATEINFISPMPMGGVWLGWNFSNINPINDVNVYPATAAIAPSDGVTGHGKNWVTTNPISNSGNRYASGIIRRRKSAREIPHAHAAAPANKIIKKI